MRRAWLVVLLLAPALAACGGGRSRPSRPVPLDAATVTCDAAQRRPLLVVVMPGGQGDPDDRLGLRRAARRAGIATLYPETEDGFRELNEQQGINDVGAVSSLLDHKLENGCYDERRLAITGVSNGAGFAVRLACEQVGAFRRRRGGRRGAARARAVPAPGARVVPGDPWHRGRGASAPDRGAPPGPQGLRAAVRRRVGAAGGLRDAAADGADGGRRDAEAYRGCAGGRHVETVLLKGTDHGWPGAGPPRPRHNPSGFDATRAVIDFIRRAPPAR